MKTSRSLFSFTILVLAFFTVAASMAEAKHKNNNGPPPPPVPPLDTRVLVKSVNAHAKTIVIENMADGKMLTYTIDSFTQIQVNGSAGKISGIKAGMQVGDYQERNHTTLDSINVEIASPPPKA